MKSPKKQRVRSSNAYCEPETAPGLASAGLFAIADEDVGLREMCEDDSELRGLG